jgi:cytochrome c heme-lyase
MSDEEVRYVIDYSAPSTPDGDPGFAWEELREKGCGKSERRGTRQAGS